MSINLKKRRLNLRIRYVYEFSVDHNILNDLSNKICIPNKTEDLNLSVFNMITGINDIKKGIKDIKKRH